MPAGLNQAVLPVLPQALGSGGVPSSCALWCSAAPSTLRLVGALGGGSSLELGRGEGPSPGSPARDGWIMGCVSKSFQSQSGIQVTPAKRNQATPPSAAAGG